MQLDTSIALSLATMAASALTTWGVVKTKLEKFEKQDDEHEKKFDSTFLSIGEIRLAISELKAAVANLKSNELGEKLDRMSDRLQQVEREVVQISAVMKERGRQGGQASQHWRSQISEPAYPPQGTDTDPPSPFDRPRYPRRPRKPGGEEG